MLLSVQQTQELLKIIDGNQLTVIGEELGSEFLTDYDKQLLKTYGIDPDSLYKPEGSSIQTSFHFGMLAEAIGQLDARKLTYEVLKQYVIGGNYIPVSPRHQAGIDSIKMQTFSSLKTMGGQIFSDVNGILKNNSQASQQEFIAKEVKEGLDQRHSISAIANDLGRKTGDWGRNFDRIVETASQTAFEWGKAAEIQRQNTDTDPLVYKIVQKGACKHCIRLYLTNGIGSQPIIFRLSELINNGSNIGRKSVDWLATLDAIHPHCRCSLQQLPGGFLWNTETQSFSTPDPNHIEETKAKRKLVRVVLGGKELYL